MTPHQFLGLLGFGAVYIGLVYLIFVRRQSQPFLPWIVCVVAQIISSYVFKPVQHFFESIIPNSANNSFGMMITSLLMLVLNILLIIAMFGKVYTLLDVQRMTPEPEAMPEENFTVNPLPLVQSAPAKVETGAVNAEAGENLTMDFVKKLLAEGKKGEAMKYLKMIAYCSKDEKTRTAAAKMFEDLSKRN